MTGRETARTVVFVAVMFVSALTADAAGGRYRLSRAAAAKAGSGRAEMVEVIVAYDRMPGAAETDAARLLQGKVRRAFGRLPMHTLCIPAHRLNSLASRPGVRFVTLDERVSSSSNSARGTAKKPTVGQPGYIAPNPSIVVAVLDTRRASASSCPGTFEESARYLYVDNVEVRTVDLGASKTGSSVLW